MMKPHEIEVLRKRLKLRRADGKYILTVDEIDLSPVSRDYLINNRHAVREEAAARGIKLPPMFGYDWEKLIGPLLEV